MSAVDCVCQKTDPCGIGKYINCTRGSSGTLPEPKVTAASTDSGVKELLLQMVMDK